MNLYILDRFFSIPPKNIIYKDKHIFPKSVKAITKIDRDRIPNQKIWSYKRLKLKQRF